MNKNKGYEDKSFDNENNRAKLESSDGKESFNTDKNRISGGGHKVPIHNIPQLKGNSPFELVRDLESLSWRNSIKCGA